MSFLNELDWQMAQTVNNPPSKWETWVRSLSWNPGGGHGYHSSILVWRIPVDRGAWQVIVHGVAKSRTQLID